MTVGSVLPVATIAPIAAALATALALGSALTGPMTRGRARRGPLAGLAGRVRAPAPVARAIGNAALDVDPDMAFSRWLGAVAVVVVSAPVLSAGPLVVIVTVAAPPVGLYALRGRRAVLRRRRLPVAVDAVASSLRSGTSVRSAIAAIADDGGALAEEFGAIASRSDAGWPLADVLTAWTSSSDPDTRLVGAALATASRLGGPAASALETTAQSLRDRAASDGLIDALAVQARLSGWLLTIAPIVFAAIMTGIDPRAGEFLFGTTLGWICLVVGLGLDVLGGLWMHRMVRSAR